MGVTTATTQPIDVPYKQLTDQNPNGTQLGASATDLVGFWGAVPIAQPASRGSLVGATGVVTIYAVTTTPASVAPNTSAEQTFTVTGAATGQVVAVVKPTAQAGLLVGAARVSATNTVGITFGNDTAATITPTAAETYLYAAVPSSMVLTAVLTPAAVQPNTSSTQFFNVAGIGVNAAVIVNKPTAQAGLVVTGVDSTSSGVVAITYQNLTAATITPTAGETYSFFGIQGIQLESVEVTKAVVLSAVSVAPNTSAEQTFTVPGLAAGIPVFVNKQTAQAGLGIAGVRVSALNTLAITFANNTAATITPTPSDTYTIGYFPGATPAAGASVAYNASAGGSNHSDLVAMGLVAGP